MIWPCVPVVVPTDHQGTAYGVMTSFQNAGQFVVPLLLQAIYHLYVSFVPCEGFFIAISAVGAAVAVLIWVLDEMWNDAILRLPDRNLQSGAGEKPGDLVHTESGSNLNAPEAGADQNGTLRAPMSAAAAASGGGVAAARLAMGV